MTTGVAALRALRAQRKRNRLGDVEWFDAAYKVYVAALFGGIALLWLSDLVGDKPVSAAQAADVLRHGPAAVGMVAIVALVVGLRSGSQGGPLALEAADVTYVMLAPVDRRAALLRPAVQRLRSAAFAGAVVGGSFGQLAGRRLPGSALAWFGSGALFGLIVGLAWVGGALVAHAAQLPQLLTSIIGVVLVAWQAAAIGSGVPGPGNLAGSLAMWGWRQRGIDVVAIAVSIALVVVGLALVGRTSLDALARRSSLVAQLRFAVTMQDLRTVVLLRRQLSYEHTRAKPWVRLRPRGTANVVWRRGWHSLFRLPLGRLIRMAALVVAAAACQVSALNGTTPLVVVTAVLTFVLGLEVMEPLSQEVDQPDRTESFPIERGRLMLEHLAAPAVALVPFTIIGAAAAVVLEMRHSNAPTLGGAIAVVAILALPTVFTGAAGAVINIVRDAPDPMASNSQQSFMPPEMAGFSTVLRTLVPLIVSIIGALSILIVRSALRVQGPSAVVPAAIRSAVACTLVVAGVAAWVRHRDAMRAKFRAFMNEGRTVTQQQRSSR
ncbi:MAG: DUF6297 family protein [Actinomycetota bacterium]